MKDSTTFRTMRHQWVWIAPAELEDAEPFVLAFNETVDPFGVERHRRVSADQFVVDDEYDQSEFTMWVESMFHVAIWQANQTYVEGKNRWAEFLKVIGNLVVDGPDIDFDHHEYELNPDGTPIAEDA